LTQISQLDSISIHKLAIRLDFDSDSIQYSIQLIILDISSNKWQIFSRKSNLLTNAVNYGSLVVAYRLH